MKKSFFVVLLLLAVFICGCYDMNMANGVYKQDNVSARVCSYVDSKSIIEKTSVLDGHIEKHKVIDSEKMYKSAKHKFTSSELCDERGQQVLPVVVKINGTKIQKHIFWGLIKIEETGKRTTITHSVFRGFDEIKTDGIYLYSDIKEPLSAYNEYSNKKTRYKLLSKGKYQVVIYSMNMDANFVTSETLLATWDFEII